MDFFFHQLLLHVLTFFLLSIDKTSCGTDKSYNECKNHNFTVAWILSSWLVSFNVSTFSLVRFLRQILQVICVLQQGTILVL